MSKTIIITDTCSDLPVELTDKYDIEILADTFQIDGKYFVEGIDFSKENFYEILPATNDKIKDVYIPSAIFLDRYKNAATSGFDHVLVLLAGPETVPMHKSAREAKTLFEEQNPTSDLAIEIVDTGVYSMATGLLVLEAGKIASQNEDFDKLLKYIKESAEKMTILVDAFHIPKPANDPTKNWDKRINLKSYHPFPALKITQNHAEEVPIIKGDHSAFDQFYKHCVEALRKNKPDYAIGYASREKEARGLALLLEEELGYSPIAIYKLGAISSHTASKAALGICYKDEN